MIKKQNFAWTQPIIIIGLLLCFFLPSAFVYAEDPVNNTVAEEISQQPADSPSVPAAPSPEEAQPAPPTDPEPAAIENNTLENANSGAMQNESIVGDLSPMDANPTNNTAIVIESDAYLSTADKSISSIDDEVYQIQEPNETDSISELSSPQGSDTEDNLEIFSVFSSETSGVEQIYCES
jgi:hypothetical protein